MPLQLLVPIPRHRGDTANENVRSKIKQRQGWARLARRARPKRKLTEIDFAEHNLSPVLVVNRILRRIFPHELLITGLLPLVIFGIIACQDDDPRLPGLGKLSRSFLRDRQARTGTKLGDKFNGIHDERLVGRVPMSTRLPPSIKKPDALAAELLLCARAFNRDHDFIVHNHPPTPAKPAPFPSQVSPLRSLCRPSLRDCRTPCWPGWCARIRGIRLPAPWYRCRPFPSRCALRL